MNVNLRLSAKAFRELDRVIVEAHLALLDLFEGVVDRVPPSWEVERERFLRGLGVSTERNADA